MFVFRSIHPQHRLDPGYGGGLGGYGRRVRAEQDYGDFAVRNLRGAGDALRGGRIQRLAVVFADNEYLVH